MNGWSSPERPQQRMRIQVTGAVQGVGFRPFVYRLATELGLAGWIRNDSQGVVIEVEGRVTRVEGFLERLHKEHPRHALLHTLQAQRIPLLGTEGFSIQRSATAEAPTAVVLPDIATCRACIADVLNPDDRRYRYPFTNCTDCGPRFSIVRALPYDRPNTTMRRFALCEDCQREYGTVTDRRFHAQPNACPRCGPHLWLTDGSGHTVAEHDEALRLTAAQIREGRVVAVKGLGGFHLMVLASHEAGVRELRARKHRWEKPLAIMAPSLAVAEQLCRLTNAERRLLESPEAPIVLARRSGSTTVAASVAPGNPYLGLMLPYTPLHRLLLSELGQPVVATSGNRSEEPICIGNEEAYTRLHSIADGFLVHDRPIERHVDDSVVAIAADTTQLLRRARGYAPLPVRLARAVPNILALGAHQKNAVALSVGQLVFVSQHIGDLDTPEAIKAHQRGAKDLLDLYATGHATLAHDLHPDYATTHLAQQWPLAEAGSNPRSVHSVAVQHHHAHLAACLADNATDEISLGVVWDGAGLGTDSTIWGGEFLLGNAQGALRVGHLRPFSLPGGSRVAREPRRAALAILWHLDALQHPGAQRALACFTEPERRVLVQMLNRSVNTPATTSAGRLFDAVAALVGLSSTVSFEGQAAMALEYAVDVGEAKGYPLPVRSQRSTSQEQKDRSALASAGHAPAQVVLSEEPFELDWGPTVLAVLDDVARGATVATMAARFHAGLADGIAAMAREIGAERVALSGGCFQNRVLFEGAVQRLKAAGHEVLLHRHVPANDGGICLGQIAVAAAYLERARG